MSLQQRDKLSQLKWIKEIDAFLSFMESFSFSLINKVFENEFSYFKWYSIEMVIVFKVIC